MKNRFGLMVKRKFEKTQMAVIKAKIVNDKFNNFLFPFTKTNVPKKRLVKAVIKVRMLVILTIKI